MNKKFTKFFRIRPGKYRFGGLLFFIILSVLNLIPVIAQGAEKMMIVIIDGARYSETFGDSNFTYIPNMWDLSKQGTIINNFYNDSLTYTARAIPALWCGSWTDIRDTVYSGVKTNYSIKPTIFEYYRKQKNMSAENCFYVLKFIQDLWLPSFDPLYGPDYWPNYHSKGNSDDEVAEQAMLILDNHHPHFIWVYLADVDSYGHSGNWNEYTAALKNADRIVADLWAKLQSDLFYKNSTTMFVSNDHGRHDEDHGGFPRHGDDCEGCRHVQFLAIGPSIKQNFVSSRYRKITDLTVTASHLLGIDPESATGDVMSEIFIDEDLKVPDDESYAVKLFENYPDPFIDATRISYVLSQQSDILIKIFNIAGEEVTTLINSTQSPGTKMIRWDGSNDNGRSVSSGLYIYSILVNNQKKSGKMLLLK